MSDRVYLDHAATSPLRPEVRDAIAGALDRFGNPSSVHTEGRQARAALEWARRQVREVLGVTPDSTVVFTSGATEANAAALQGSASIGDGVTVLASAVEHPSVLGQRHVETVPVDGDGRLVLDALEARLAKGDVRLLALMLANNETGVVQPVAEAARLARAAGVGVHVDAVQALGRLPIDVEALGADSLALSAHKIGGPKGVGALWLREPDRFAPWLVGGGQEGRRRAGTENTLGIIGFAAALGAMSLDEPHRLEVLRQELERGLAMRLPEVRVVAGGVARVPHISALTLPGLPASTQVMALDLAGIAVSAGAACSSGKVTTSHVLDAMGFDYASAGATIRASLGWSTSAGDIARFLAAYDDLARRRQRAAA